MIKHIKYFLLIMTTLTFGFTICEARSSCPQSVIKDVSKAATYVKANYEVFDNSTIKTLTDGKDSTEYKIPNYNFEISIYNITPELYVTIKNNVTNETIKVTHDMTTDGIYTFSNDDFGRIYNYTFQVSSAHEECYNKKLRTLRLTLPRYNAYSEFNYCKNSSSYYCQRFVGTELGIKNTEDFYKKISVNNKKAIEKGKIDVLTDIIKSHWKLYLSIFGGVLILFIGTIIFLRSRKKKEEDF